MRIIKPSLFSYVALALALNVSVPMPSIHAQTSPAAIQLDRVPDHADLTQTVQLAKTLPQWVSSSREIGSLPDSTPVSVEVVIARAPAVQAAFEQLLEDQQNPNSPRYHQWLTPKQIGEQYGATQHDLDALSAWLTAQGMTLTGIAPSRIFVRATASAGVVGNAFKTQFRTYSVGDKSRFSVATEPSIPAAFSSIIASISGLSQVELHPMHRIRPAAAPKPDYTTAGGYHYVFPADFATIFDINSVYNAGINGTGQHVAIIGESDIVASDIAAFEAKANLPSNTPKTIVVPSPAGVDPGIVDGDEGESDLDLQRVIGVAPGVSADFVISGTVGTTQGIDVAMRYEIETLLDPVMTLSYGGCEGGTTGANLATDNAYNSLFQTGAAAGISIFISSADSGAASCDGAFEAAPATQFLSINFLCSSGSVTCVGGTEFNDTASPSTYWSTSNGTGYESALGYIPEGAWNESTVVGTSSTTYQVAASGGGVSKYITKPSFQTGLGVPADGFRDVPDVSFPAADHDGYFGCEADVVFSPTATGNCATGGGLIFSGTSAAAPGMAGVAALLNQKLGTGGTGTGQGNLNPLLYKLAALNSGNPFHDTTLASAGFSSCDVTTPSTCNNSTPGPTTLTGGLAGYAIGTGYDQVTGWGSLDVNAFLTSAAALPTLPATTTTLTANPTTITTAQTVVFSSTVTSASGTPTGTVQFSSNGTALGSPVTLVNGTASTSAQTFSNVGTYTITASYSGSTSYATSSATSLAFVVTAVPKIASSTSILATTATATTTTAVGFTATVTGSSGTPTGTVQFKLNGSNLGSAVTLSSGSATLSNQTLPAGADLVTAVYSGDGTYATSTSAAATVTVTALASSTAFTLSPASVATTANTTITFTVTGSGPTPTGSVTLKSGSTALGTSTLVGGTVSVTATPASYGLGTGSYILYGVYSGDATYATSTSSNQTLTVTAPPAPTLTLSPSPSSLNIVLGNSASDSITLTSTNFSGTETLGCSVAYNGSGTATDVPSCSITTPTIPANGTATATLSISSTAAYGHSGPIALHRTLAVSGTALCGLLALLLPISPARRKNLRRILALIVTAASLAAISGCGGGGTALTNPGTTPGSYTITVNASGVVAASTTIALTVQN
jgi:subtilase family serine protease